jgi:hypothetical protein
VIANPLWAQGISLVTGLASFDPQGKYAEHIKPFGAKAVSDMSKIENAKAIVIADLDAFFKIDGNKAALEKFVQAGGNAVILGGGKVFADWRGDEIKLYRGFKSSRDGGEIVVPKVPESPVFFELKPMDMAWFADEGKRAVPMACTAVYQINRENKNVRELAESIRIHAYLQKPSDVLQYSGTPLLEIKDGKGRIIASEMRLSAAKDDPIAGKLLSNIIKRATDK